MATPAQNHTWMVRVNNRCKCGELIWPQAKACHPCATQHNVPPSQKARRHEYMDGEKNNLWNGGITLYRRQLKKKCERCPNVAKLHVHHIDRNRRNNKPDNLMTLCATCHQWEHHIKKCE